MGNITSLVDPFDGELSRFGYRLSNIFGFQIDKSALQTLIDNSEGDTIQIGFDRSSVDPVLRELNPRRLRLAMKLATNMLNDRDSSVLGLIQLQNIFRDIKNIEDKLNNKKWMD